MSTTMQRYRDWGPTPYDRKGLACDGEDWADWWVVMIHTPNIATNLDCYNWETAQTMLDGAGVDYATPFFGHWATPFEVLLCSDETEARKIVEALADYPILGDGMAWSEYEWSAHESGACDEHCSICESEECDHE